MAPEKTSHRTKRLWNKLEERCEPIATSDSAVHERWVTFVLTREK
jgi:hypothetical protein